MGKNQGGSDDLRIAVVAIYDGRNAKVTASYFI